ncbi:4-hydroxyphenylpyruvate dioxygenase [Arthrobacter sp. MYb224]|uniref:bifunctional sugar phosphate isomerase/epimerase/4-hydroxyphenylpyruvate dioxygenase family protein n=1 Tax=unclassified Arthrobacter TaxID=235627 RepID=UPI000CFB73C0|nr:MULTISPECIES: sugar phosphate isomerase/epimerase and 4-hydroxyphenylpyruvate domain-containing protein [unclassified Arthrobacter]PRA00426.1 4-hydroxyphenylpyruvate dioxygenase [Arthrobacter sp. MYb224]PRA04618.1 4-hydroxyphenylpyruvate dioxygenase [Arthrobacter sp. MYb229]PRB51470.1 4-hydroxyphenylpyruvate dioxygenase [Arthrobacter sp. MYb216]
MRTSIATVCLSGTLEEKMLACAKAGFDGIEIFEQDLTVSPMSPEEVKALAHRLGLTLDLFQPFRDFEGVEEELLLANLRRAEAKFELMQRLGMDLMLLCSNVGTATIDDDELFAEQIRRLADVAARYGVRIAYEALAWGKYVDTYQHSWEIVKLVDRENVGLCIDSFHILSRGDDPAQIARIPGEKIFFVQLADAPVLTMDILSWSRHYRVFPGEGGFELDAFLGHLVRSGYSGIVSLEIFNDVFRQSNVERTAVDGLRSLIWLQARTAALLGSDAQDYPLELDALPGVQQALGFDFAEIRTEDPELIAGMLAQLGFAFLGQHRRKPVQLWRAGNARIIVNSQRSRGVTATVSGLGVQVPDPVAGRARATDLLAKPVLRHHTRDEQELAGFRAPDATEVFFGSVAGTRLWETEFGAHRHSPEEAQRGGITGIDHINLAQPWQAFDESVLFYTSVLNLQARPGTEVPSPMGLVRSQVLRTEDGCVRLALNIVPKGLEAAIESHHEYPEHVALHTDDVVALARRAQRAGMEFLQVPANYYEDLAARFSIDERSLSTLKELNLLYDRDEHGEFLHFYTATVGNMFFEVLERRDGYDGYGAPNAPVRLAAQFEHNRFDRH